MVGDRPNPDVDNLVGALSCAYCVAPSTIGSMRGLADERALLIGLLTAPMIDRCPRAATALLGLSIRRRHEGLAADQKLRGLILAIVALGAALTIT